MKTVKTVLAAAAALLAVAWLAVRMAGLPADIRSPAPASTEILDRHGIPLRATLVDETHYLHHEHLQDLPPHVVAATLAAEDHRFFSHPGFDPLAMARAAINACRGARPLSGASTITQQLVKEPGARTLARKCREFLRALRVEAAWTKERILEEYLNHLDYGNLRRGIGAASRYYFGKPPSDLSPAEAAFLAALPRAPSRLDPHRNWAGARERQQWILHRMAQAGAIGETELRRALAEPLALRPRSQEFAAPHFVDLILQRRGILPPDGGPVRTTLDLALNRRVEMALNRQLARLKAHNASGAAAVVLHNPTGEVLALAGSGDYFAAGAGQVNGAWIARSPGSAVKPFTYLLALEQGANPGSIVADVPASFATPTGEYRPDNYNHRFHGPVSLRHALGNSLNVAAVRTLELSGGCGPLHHLLRELGLTTLDRPTEYYGLGLTLGNGEVRLLELANAYGTLARGGLHRPFRLLARDNGPDDAGRQLFSASSAFLVSDMLADNTARSASFGLNSYLNLPFRAAAKTGTSSDYRDNWAIGYTPEFTVAVWVGNPDGRPMKSVTGVTGAAPAMHEIMRHLHDTRGTTWFARPADVREGLVHSLTGHAVASGHPAAVREMFVHPPQPESPSDYDTGGRVILGTEYREWVQGPQNSLGDLAVVRGHNGPLRIVSPSAGTVYFLDPDLPASAQRIPFVACGNDNVRWSCATLDCLERGADAGAVLREGIHTITGTAGGMSASTWILVKSL